jgi:hypothetical protein
MQNKAKLLPLMNLLVVSFLLTACTSSPPEPTMDATQGVQTLAGTYTMTLTEEDIQNAKLPSFETDLVNNVGNWQFVLSADGKFSAELNGNFIAEGSYEVTGNKIQIGVGSVCDNCSCASNIGRYYWSLNGDQLVFQKIGDSCNGMVLILTTNPFTRQP